MCSFIVLILNSPIHLGPLQTRDCEPVTVTLQILSLVENAEPVQVCFTLRLRDQRSMCMQDGCQVYMDSYMTSNGSCFMITWTVFKNHLLEARLTQNQVTMALRTLTTIDLVYFIMCEDPCGFIETFIEITFGWGPSHIWVHTTLEVPWPHRWCWRRFGTAFGHFVSGSHNFVVKALGLCMKWPLVLLQNGKIWRAFKRDIILRGGHGCGFEDSRDNRRG